MSYVVDMHGESSSEGHWTMYGVHRGSLTIIVVVRLREHLHSLPTSATRAFTTLSTIIITILLWLWKIRDAPHTRLICIMYRQVFLKELSEFPCNQITHTQTKLIQIITKVILHMT